MGDTLRHFKHILDIDGIAVGARFGAIQDVTAA